MLYSLIGPDDSKENHHPPKYTIAHHLIKVMAMKVSLIRVFLICVGASRNMTRIPTIQFYRIKESDIDPDTAAWSALQSAIDCH